MGYNMIDFFDKVAIELRNKNFSKNYRWIFSEYNIFRSKLRPSVSLEEFFEEMKLLCDKGIFIEADSYTRFPDYILTEQGEYLIYK